MTDEKLSETIDALSGVSYAREYSNSNYNLKLGIFMGKVICVYKDFKNQLIRLDKQDARNELLMLASVRMNLDGSISYRNMEVDLGE